MKECGKCYKTKEIKEFAITGRGKQKGKKRHHWCKLCVKEYDKKRWQDGTKKKFNEKTKREYYKRYYEYLRDKECVDCGEDRTVVLEFDHVGKKTENISTLVRDTSWKKVLKEIEQCEVVCANCHRVRTATRAGWLKLMY